MTGHSPEPWNPCVAVPRRKVLKAGAAGLAMLPFAAFLAACEGTKSDAGKQPATSERARKLVLDFHGGRVAAPTLFNPFVTGFTINAGFHQALSEPLFRGSVNPSPRTRHSTGGRSRSRTRSRGLTVRPMTPTTSFSPCAC
jgi:hypothetical protein